MIEKLKWKHWLYKPMLFILAKHYTKILVQHLEYNQKKSETSCIHSTYYDELLLIMIISVCTSIWHSKIWWRFVEVFLLTMRHYFANLRTDTSQKITLWFSHRLIARIIPSVFSAIPSKYRQVESNIFQVRVNFWRWTFCSYFWF